MDFSDTMNDNNINIPGGNGNQNDYDNFYDKECPDYNYKLILVGHARVGKTSLTNRFVNDMFNDHEKSTRTVQISKKMVKIESALNENKWSQLHIWDTLGQEKFKALAPLFFRKAIGAFLVYDCTNKESFEALDSWF